MSRYTGPKHKLSRREGVNLTGTRSSSLERQLAVPPGGQRGRRHLSDYAVRLRAKQRVKNQYGVTERQLRRMFDEASRIPGPAGENLLRLLERRLDNVIYRIGFARTRPMARQLVNHEHVFVNNKKVNVPSYQVKPGDIIKLTPVATKMPAVQEELNTGQRVVPPWLVREGDEGHVVGMPRREDIDMDIREDLIVEFYAR